MKDIPDVQVTAMCDVREDNLALAKKIITSPVTIYKDYKDMMRNRKLDAVIIATPLYLHYPMAVDALEHGKHVYLEKAISYDIPQAIDLMKRVGEIEACFPGGPSIPLFRIV